ncbi:MAG: hypothetical protein B7Y41_11220 [Hydrogenophilales bacterium 28-61-23]|nr:MAG: hypothetical protein B7Y41_11220 [Hydrogenophilales bacterium 28-61-23]
MPRKYFRKYLPDHAAIHGNKYLRVFRPLLKHPNLWHLNRHSVAGGVALGLFAGLIPGPLQMFTAAILAIIFRVNLPVAVVTTLYTNPFTWGPLILAAYAIGSWVTPGNRVPVASLEFDWQTQNWVEFPPAFWHWLWGLGETFLIGDLILASSLAVFGYFAVQFAWRLYIQAYVRRRRARPKPMAKRAADAD